MNRVVLGFDDFTARGTNIFVFFLNTMVVILEQKL